VTSPLALSIDTLTHGPFGLGRSDGKVVLVPLTVPGDRVEVDVVEEHKRYSVARLRSVVEPSPARRTAPCPYTGDCGGCSWQEAAYETQLQAKQRNVADALARVGGLAGFELLPILPGSREFHYRRRIVLHVDGERRIGFHRASSREVVEVRGCHIAEPDTESGIELAVQWVGRLATPVSEVEILSADRPGQVILSAKSRHAYQSVDGDACAELVGGPAAGIVMAGPGWRQRWGETALSCIVDGDLRLTHDAGTFSQVNTEGNRRLVDEVMAWAGFGAEDDVLELYAGAGNLTLPAARRARRVTAVEANARLVRNGRRNAADNDVRNIRWWRHDVPAAVDAFIRQQRRFTTIVLNPPRDGAKRAAPRLAALGAGRVLYVSCDPATLARDLGRLTAQGYALRRVRPVDLFPQTFHVETIAELVRE